ncbi:type III-B CRISPR module RAMP protein Cmr4 [Hahella sp. CCB-MM4]|uniref:type III-B CRISPR module RAMP protein Cmr4 n=1 Tax=Hahella sp. (strain CCB-MM4) TaxID=1926491 RepID=UPI000B9B9E26|nr:type III-B CRISPR module RAMP protein Cmr4 [Hahella sp. CCB-MM4]OZG70349.1 type III-B CRISPR module RAMP protein Cmr4 [Hahella sp. CCB-MM4]
MELNTYHLYTHTVLHCGTGQSVGVVDLPIARDRATHLPLVPASSVRGVLREAITETKGVEVANRLFGPQKVSTNEDSYAGALSIGDAHLLLLPVRALQGIIAYVTCPFILKRYRRDMKLNMDVPVPEGGTALHAEKNQNLLINKDDSDASLIVLEDLDLKPQRHDCADQWADVIAAVIFPGEEKEVRDARDDLTQRFLILPDSVFIFLAETATEIRTRIRINQETGVVQKGALWSEENLPAETVLWGGYALTESRSRENNATAEQLAVHIPTTELLQLGGNAGIGHGLVRFFKEASGGSQ